MFKRLIAVLIVLYWPRLVFADHPLITDDTATRGKGKFQFDFNGENSHKNKDGVMEDAVEIAAIFTYRMNDQIDVILGIPYSNAREKDSETTTNNGFSDTLVALKWRFYEREGLSLALKPVVKFPTGNDEKGLGQEGQPTTYLLLPQKRSRLG